MIHNRLEMGWMGEWMYSAKGYVPVSSHSKPTFGDRVLGAMWCGDAGGVSGLENVSHLHEGHQVSQETRPPRIAQPELPNTTDAWGKRPGGFCRFQEPCRENRGRTPLTNARVRLLEGCASYRETGSSTRPEWRKSGARKALSYLWSSF